MTTSDNSSDRPAPEFTHEAARQRADFDAWVKSTEEIGVSIEIMVAALERIAAGVPAAEAQRIASDALVGLVGRDR